MPVVRPLPIRPAGYLAGLIATCLFLGSGVNAQPAGDLTLDISDGLVTLNARDVGLQDVIDKIAVHSAMLIVLQDPLDTRVTLAFEGLELHKALKRIMRGRSYLLVQTPASRSTLRIFSDGEWKESDRDGAADLRILQDQLSSNDHRAKKTAIKDLGKLAAETAIPSLAFALTDESKEIRFKAVQALALFDTDDVAIALATAANDEHAGIRAEAAYWLGTLGGETAIRVLEHTLHDPDSDVREAAENALLAISR